jgi:glucosamine-6-phosphate deaminase
MLHVHPNVPLKETLTQLSNFAKFSLIEKIEPKFFQTSAEGSKKVAEVIRDSIIAKNKISKEPFVLGLATGNTPLKVYKELVAMHKKG